MLRTYSVFHEVRSSGRQSQRPEKAATSNPNENNADFHSSHDLGKPSKTLSGAGNRTKQTKHHAIVVKSWNEAKLKGLSTVEARPMAPLGSADNTALLSSTSPLGLEQPPRRQGGQQQDKHHGRPPAPPSAGHGHLVHGLLPTAALVYGVVAHVQSSMKYSSAIARVPMT